MQRITAFYRTKLDLPSEGKENVYYVITSLGRVLQWSIARKTFVSASPIDTYHILHDITNDNWLNSKNESVGIKIITEKSRPMKKRPNIFKELLSRRKK